MSTPGALYHRAYPTMTMDGEDTHLDTTFDQMLVEMKPHVLRLPHKSDRQRCAVWIKKFCEPPSSGVVGRKNRNAYTRLLLHMLKKSSLEGPFIDKPDPGPLPTLPSYMSIYFDDLKISSDQNRVPEWVAGELGSDVSSLPGVDILDSPALRFQAAQQRFTAALEQPTDIELTQRKTLFPQEPRNPPDSRGADRNHLPSYDKDWPNGTSYSTFLTTGGNSLFKDDSTLPRGPVGREVDMQKKMLEAKFQEDRLRLQQKHDTTVQKILDRKNLELEELKRHYRTKSKEQEEATAKMERKLNHMHKELGATKEAREQETGDLKKLLEEATSNKQQELDRKMSEIQSQYEEEKFVLQKQHTKNIQDLLDDTNSRLSNMESEYNTQMDATSAVIRELEARVQQLGSEGENLGKIRNQLERDKIELEGRLDRLQADNMALQDKTIQLEKDYKRQKEDHETELRTMKNKYEANLDYMKQEQTLAAAKAQDRLGDYEQQVSQLKQALDNSEQQRQTQIRDMEQSYQQDKIHLENLHDKKIRNLQQELDQLDQDYQKKLRKMEQSVREKDDEMKQLVDGHKHQSVQSEEALNDFKSQIERNSAKLYNDMKQQMERVEQDLNRSKMLREKQAKEFQRQLEEEKYQHSKQMAEKQLEFDQEKASMLRDVHVSKEMWQSDKDHDLEALKETFRKDINTLEQRNKEKHDRDNTTISELEQQMQLLREELSQANSLRKQQLMELGLLREDEKHKMDREQDIQISKLRSDYEQQRLAAKKKKVPTATLR